VEPPETRYAWNGSVGLAYQVIGDGPIDLLYLQGACSHVDMNWESPYLAGLLRALARDARLIITDRRGLGCSDRFSPTDIPPFEVFTDDIIGDRIRSQRASRPSSPTSGTRKPMLTESWPRCCSRTS
jgi:pimeloyl-ACP methyl ester carboxylesterase